MGGLVARRMKVAVILYVSAQLAAFVLFISGDVLFGSESRWGNALFSLGLWAYVTAGVAGAVAIVLFVPGMIRRLTRSVARVGVLPLIGSLFGVGPNPDALDDVIDDALGVGEADDEDGSRSRVIADEADASQGRGSWQWEGSRRTPASTRGWGFRILCWTL
jgi:hypothetical protein